MHSPKRSLFLVLVHLVLLGQIHTSCQSQQERARWEHDLKISKNGHHLIKKDGKPFYWVGDTGWAMFQMLSREEVDVYLDNRAAKGFTVIQSVAFWYPHGAIEPLGPLNAQNAYGHRPFMGDADAPETAKPLLVDGGDAFLPNDYWDHADYVVEAVKRRGMKLVLLPCWGNAFINNRMKGSYIEFTEEEARAYGKFLGKRYRKEPHIIWCLGGDVDPQNFGDKDQRSVYRAMAEGIGRGASGNPELTWNTVHPGWDKTLMTFHGVRTPNLSGEGLEGGSSSNWFHKDAWLDLNMMETFKWMHQIYPYVSEDFEILPTKPTVMGEGAYEIGKYGKDCGFITPLKVRQQGYHTFFAGATGYTYGHWSIWPFRGAYCDITWQGALDHPGATQVGKIMREFIEQQNIYDFVPDQSLILSDNPNAELRQCAMMRNDKQKLLVYLPQSNEISLDVSKLKGDGLVKPNWFDPRDGNTVTGESQVEHIFSPPVDWEDAILILEKER